MAPMHRPKFVPEPESEPTTRWQEASKAIRIVLGAGLFLSIVTVFAATLVVVAPYPHDGLLMRGHPVSAAWRKLEGTLKSLAAAWSPDDRNRLVAAAQAERDLLAPQIQRALGRPTDGRILQQALVLAAALEVVEVRREVGIIAQSGSVEARTLAISTAEQLSPWSPEELTVFLGDVAPEVQVAALELAGKREDVPVREIVALLRSPFPQVRDAAVAAMPRHPDRTALEELCLLTRDEDAAVAATALAALGRTEASDGGEAAFLAALARDDAAVRSAALDALARRGTPIGYAQVVHRIAADHGLDAELRARALYCLERTDGCDLRALRRDLPTFEPLLRYFAARCLIRAEQREGIAILIDLLERADSGPSEVSLASRRILTWLSRQTPGAELQDLSAWASDPATSFSGRYLPSPTLSFLNG
jgi:HEAT repeat protein